MLYVDTNVSKIQAARTYVTTAYLNLPSSNMRILSPRDVIANHPPVGQAALLLC
jgi:hypothetical protein